MNLKTTPLFQKLKEANWLFLLVGLIFGLFFVFLTPPLWGFDEVAHFNRAYQIAEGELVPSQGAQTKMSQSLVELEYYVYGDLIDNEKYSIFRKDIDNNESYDKLLSRKFSQDMQGVPIIAAYSPAAYVAPSLGIFIARSFNLSIGSTITYARLFSLLLYIGLSFLALYILRERRVKWVIFLVALLPMSLFQAAVVSADGALIGLSLLFMASFLELILKPDTRKKKLLLSIVFITAVLMPVLKINYLFLSLGIALLPIRLFKTKKSMYALKLLVVTLSIILSLVWSIVTNVTRSGEASERSDGRLVVPLDQIDYILHYPIRFVVAAVRTIASTSDSYIMSMTSAIGWNGTQLPFVFILLIFLSAFIAAIYAKKELTTVRKKILILGLFAALGIGSVFGVLYIVFNPTGYPVIEGVQGRYFIPFLVPFILLVALISPLEVKIRERTIPILFTTLVTVTLVFSGLYYYLATY